MSDREAAATEANGTLLCGETGWHYGMCDCFNGGAMAFLTRWFCGQCIWGRAMEIALEKNCIICCILGGFCFCCMRGQLREKYNIENGSALCDFAKSYFCALCTIQMLIQEIEDRENKKIGCFGKVEGEDGGGEMTR